jgi:hypothetical protein
MKKFRGSSDYVASQELMNAVNVAIQLQKPLLIKGEPAPARPCWLSLSQSPWICP